MAIAHTGAVDPSPPPATAGRGLPSPLDRQLALLLDALRRSALPATTRIGLMSSYHVGWTDQTGRRTEASSGKFVRGCLALWAAECCGADPRAALPVATAVEWIHNFTLVHDDIQDGDRERRHRPTVWAVWGEAQAINAGDGMHALAYQALLEGNSRPRLRLRAAASLNRAILAVIEGQCLDLALEGRTDTTVATYTRLARAKTGALIGAALEAGALMVGAPGRRAMLLRRAGIELGMAFQVRDDWLGTWGDSALTGKARGDLGRRKLTYPVIIGHAHLRGAARREFRRLYAQPQGDEQRILELLDEAGTSARVSEALLQHSRCALESLRCTGLPREALEDFDAIVAFVTQRAA